MGNVSHFDRSSTRPPYCVRVRARVRPKKQFGAEMDDDAGKLGHKRRPSIGYHFTEASRYGSAPAPRCPGAGAPATAPFRLPSNSCWSSSRTGSRAQGYGDGHGGRVRVTHNARRVGAYDRSDGLSSDESRGRGGAPRQQVEAQRHRSSGRRDLSGCLRPCLLAYYDLCFLGMDSRVANWVICKVGDCPYPLYPG